MSPELRNKIASFGCNDTCVFGVVGQHTNGGCKCLGIRADGKITPNERAKVRAGIYFLRDKIDELEKRVLELKAEKEELEEDYNYAVINGSSPYSTE